MKASICIASYNMAHLLPQTIRSCREQTYKNIEIIVYDDCSTDNTKDIDWESLEIKYYMGETNVGVGEAFNRAIEKASGEIVMLMCADDLFAEKEYVSDVVNAFHIHHSVGYVTRLYYQFTTDRDKPVRAWHDYDPIVLANNPSGLAFRKKALEGKKCSNKMFIETSYLAASIVRENTWEFVIMTYDAIAVRVHESTSTQKGYYLKRRVSSPVQDWYSIGGSAILKDYVSLIQIKCNYTTKAVLEEIWNFMNLRPLNLLSPSFYFYSILVLLTPRAILRKLPHIYRKYIGSCITKRRYRK